MFDKILGVVNNVLNSTGLTGELLKLFKGKEQKANEFKLQMAREMQAVFDAELEDLKSAREMQIEALKQPDNFSKRFLYYLTAFLIFSTVAVSILPFFMVFPEENVNAIQRATDFLYTITGARIIAFFFGSKFNDEKI